MANSRAIIFWLIGAICVFIGALVAGTVDPSVLGATTSSVIISYTISFVLILLGGMFWISTAVMQGEED
jgi:hypothetical protein